MGGAVWGVDGWIPTVCPCLTIAFPPTYLECYFIDFHLNAPEIYDDTAISEQTPYYASVCPLSVFRFN